jgi:peptide/nickel transport system permease protein
MSYSARRAAQHTGAADGSLALAPFVVRRLGFLVLTLLVTSLVVFVMAQLIPGDEASAILGREASQEALQELRAKLGLDRPLPAQYGRWLSNFILGEWGESSSARSPILPLVTVRLGNSLRLALVTLVIAIPVAMLLGIWAGVRHQRPVDTVINIGSLAVVSLPEFITGLILIQVLAHWLGWLPASSALRPNTSFLAAIPFLLLPALTATLVLLAYIARLMRAGVVEELKRGYVRTAVLKGLSTARVVRRHVLRNALLPTVTVIAISFGWLTGGLIVIENVFNYPGLGRLLVFAINNRDLPLIQAITVVVVIAVVSANLLADLVYAYLDPRIRIR